MHTTTPDFAPDFFEMMDDYTGPEKQRAEHLAEQWTCRGDNLSQDEWDGLLTDAYAVIAAWRLSKIDAELSRQAQEQAEGRIGDLMIDGRAA